MFLKSSYGAFILIAYLSLSSCAPSQSSKTPSSLRHGNVETSNRQPALAAGNRQLAASNRQLASSTFISTILGVLGTAISPLLGPLGPALGVVLGPVISNIGSQIATSAFSAIGSVLRGAIFQSSIPGGLPGAASSYDAYIINVPKYGSFVLLANHSAFGNQDVLNDIEIDAAQVATAINTQAYMLTPPAGATNIKYTGLEENIQSVYSKFPLSKDDEAETFRDVTSSAKSKPIGRVHLIPLSAAFQNFMDTLRTHNERSEDLEEDYMEDVYDFEESQ